MNSINRLTRTLVRSLAVVAMLVATLPAQAFLTPPRDDVIEFLNDITKRRVLLASQAEMDFVEKGLAGPGWRRSGLVLTVAAGIGTPIIPDVFRFYAPSVNSHFFTIDPAEVEVLKNPASGWIYEGNRFQSLAPAEGSCPALSPVPVYRLYNNRAQFRDTIHRFTPDQTVRQALIGQGWIYEGVALCAIGWYYKPNAIFEIDTTKVLPSTECENESLNLGACVGLNQSPLMPYFVSAGAQTPPLTYMPYGSVVSLGRLPRFVTAPEGDIITPVNSNSLAEITEHAFVQMSRPGNFPFYGIYVNSRDRTTSPLFPYMSINPLYQFVTTPPKENEPDKRLMPWRDGIVRTLELSFTLEISYVRRADEGSHAISHPTLELIDTRTRRNLYITLAGGQTVPLSTNEAEDYFAADIGTGKVIVSTSFRANPGFGERIYGNSFFCSATASIHQCDQPSTGSSFAFRLRPADIAYVIAKARKLDQTLSPNIADYAIDNFSFNNEVFGNAELGVGLSSYRLEIKDQQY